MEYVNGIEEYILRNFFKLFTSFHFSSGGGKGLGNGGAMLKNIKTFGVLQIFAQSRWQAFIYQCASVCLWNGCNVGQARASIRMYVLLVLFGCFVNSYNTELPTVWSYA